MGVHHPYRLDLCADDEDPSQLIIRPGWDAPHVRCFPRTFSAWACLLRQVGTVLGSPYDYVVAGLAYTNPGSRHTDSGWRPRRQAQAARRSHARRLAAATRSGLVAGLVDLGPYGAGTWWRLFGGDVARSEPSVA